MNGSDEKIIWEFYQARYAGGYMDEPLPHMETTIRDVMGALELPPRGKALDFGWEGSPECGPGGAHHGKTEKGA